MEFSEEYPNKPPVVRFVSKMFHPNGKYEYAFISVCVCVCVCVNCITKSCKDHWIVYEGNVCAGLHGLIR